MKHCKSLMTLLCLILASLCLFTACSQDAEDAEVAKFEGDMTAFIQSNRAQLEELSEKIISSGEYAFYTCATSTGAGNTYILYEYVDEDGDGIYTQQVCTNEDVELLADMDFLGDVTHTTGEGADVVAFRAAAQPSAKAVYMVYCKSDAGMKYLKNGFLPDARRVTVTPVEGNWYLVKA